MPAPTLSPPAAQALPVQLAGQLFYCLLEGGLYWPDQRLLIVSDLHLEKSSSQAQRGVLLPPYDSRATLERLAHLQQAYQPRQVICLGDSLHDRTAADRLGGMERTMLAQMVAQADWVWIAGNHDPQTPAWLGGRVVDLLTVGPIMFRHEAGHQLSGLGEVSGHYHPSATLQVRGTTLRGRCFAEDGLRLIMPAFGQFTGGLNVTAPTYQPLFPFGFRAHVMGRKRFVSLPVLAAQSPA